MFISEHRKCGRESWHEDDKILSSLAALQRWEDSHWLSETLYLSSNYIGYHYICRLYSLSLGLDSIEGKGSPKRRENKWGKSFSECFLDPHFQWENQTSDRGVYRGFFVCCEGFLFSHSPWLQFMRTQCKNIFKKLSKFVFKIKSFTISHL